MRKAAGDRRGMVLAIGLALALLPLQMHFADGHLEISSATAAAKNGGGNGGGGGKGGGSGGGKGGGKGGDNGKGGEKAGGKSKGAAAPARPAPVAKRAVGLQVVHHNGILERIRSGRYEMKDNKGRTIINRVATNADRQRLVQFAVRPQS